MPRYSDNKGKSISLVKEIAKGGEGTVWQTNRSGYLAKIYHQPNPEQIQKLKLMIANPPQNPTAGQNHIAISWPTDLIKDNRGNGVGFLMPEIKNAKELICVYHPRNRKTHAPAFNWYCLHIIALNLVSIVRSIHAKNYVIGDISVKNILVNDRSLVSLIDTDSFQVTDPNTRQVYRCHVGSEGFTPPELIGKKLSQLTQTRYNDRFRLAVIIHYLLFGYHPFMGKWTGSGDPPGQDEAVSQGDWPYGKNSSLEPSPNTIPLQILHPELEKCFLKCFNDAHKSPTSRPSPEDWFKALQLAINDLVVCSRNKNHVYSKRLSHCYWCDRENTLGVDIFPPVKNPIAPKPIPLNNRSSQSKKTPKTPIITPPTPPIRNPGIENTKEIFTAMIYVVLIWLIENYPKIFTAMIFGVLIWFMIFIKINTG
jgi:DNA-binding helix-hairpin-helix protein with protein kinase domain